jgi:hypothetical protein
MVALAGLAPATAQTAAADSIVQKQLLRHKQKLGLSEGQFVQYKAISKVYFDKLAGLAATTRGDTASFNSQAKVHQQKKMDDLAAILTPQQMQLYLAMLPKKD